MVFLRPPPKNVPSCAAHTLHPPLPPLPALQTQYRDCSVAGLFFLKNFDFCLITIIFIII